MFRFVFTVSPGPPGELQELRDIPHRVYDRVLVPFVPDPREDRRRTWVDQTVFEPVHYRGYFIFLTATVFCLPRPSTTPPRTVPGKVEQPTLLYENSTRLIVSWPRPARPAGPVDYYQLVVAHHSGLTNSQTTAGALTSPSALVSTQIQENSNQLYKSTCNCRSPPLIFGRCERILIFIYFFLRI